MGDSFLTDNTTIGNSGNLRITYTSPVAQAAGVILDVDCRNCNAGGTCGDCEQWTIDAYDAGGALIDTFVIDGAVGPPSPPCGDTNGPGDAAAFGWFFDHGVADISSVVIRYTGTAASVGLAFDNFTPSSIPDLDASVDATDEVICYGQATTLTADAIGGVPPYMVTWQRETAPDVWTGIGTGFSFDVHPTSDATYRAIVEDATLNMVTTNEVGVQVQNITIEVSQESAPGAGDFNANVLGFLTPIESTDTALEYYGWTGGTTPFSGPEPTLTDNRSHLFVVAASDGLALFVVHDTAVSAAGGRAETRIDLA